MDPMHAQFTKRYNIPLDHLDYKYISACTDVRELENIYKVLMSGDEGRFPDLESHCEARLTALAPNSRVLRKDQPPLRPGNLDQAEWASITSDLNSWAASVSAVGDGHSNGDSKPQPEPNDPADLPPVRGVNATISLTRKTETALAEAAGGPAPAVVANRSSSAKRPMPRSYAEWSKLEKQLGEEADEPQEPAAAAQSSGKAGMQSQQQLLPPRVNRAQGLPSRLRVDGMSAQERLGVAEAEKAKGNEAFRSGDYEEAVVYYTRSLSASQMPAAYNNRAFAYLKLQKYTACVKDCSRVLKSEPDNAKALLRRATAYHRVHRSADARADLQRLLALEPKNSAATTLLAEVDALLAKRAPPAAGAKRMVIEEVGSSDEVDDEDGASVGNNIAASKVLNSQPVPSENKVPDTSNATQISGTDVSQKSRDLPINNTKSQKNPDPPKSEKSPDPPKSQKNPDPPKSQNPPKDSTKVTATAKVKKSKKSENPQKSNPTSADAPVSVPTDEFESAKEAGNQLFKAGNYARAIELYNRCTELRPNDPVSYTNRAVCYIKLERPNDAVYECNMALDVDRHNMKAIFRRGVARKMLSFHREALLDLNLAKSFDPLNKQIAQEIAEVEAAMRSSGGRRVLVQEVEDDEDEEENSNDDEKAAGQEDDSRSVSVIRDVGGIITESVVGLPTADSTADMTPEKTANNSDLAADSVAPEESSMGIGVAPAAEDAESAPSNHASSTAFDQTASASGTNIVAVENSASVSETNIAASENSASASNTNIAASENSASASDTKAVPASIKMAVSPVDSPRLNFQEPVADQPSLRPDCTAFEFTQAWMSAARAGSRPGQSARAAHTELLLCVEPSRLPRLLSNKLDGPLLQQILAAVTHGLLGREPDRATRVLLSLPTADRFQFVAMFMDGKEKAELSDTLTKLESMGAASPDDVGRLKSAYQLL